jgi:site-specific recombinase XerC
MINDSWKQDATIQHWFKKIDNKRTIENYRNEIPKFLEFVNMKPCDIVQQRVTHLATTDQTQRRIWEDKYVEYKHLLEGKGLRKNTIKSYLRTVSSFFSNNNVNLNLSRNDTKVTPNHKKDIVPTQWTPSNEEVRVLYRMAKESRDRAILLTLYQSGFSEVDVSSMNIEEFPFYDEKGDWKIPITDDLYHQRLRAKTNILQQTCISREALEEIRVMLQSRGYPKEGALFVSFRGQPLDVREINMAMKEIVKRAFNGKSKEWETKHLRDAFMNAVEKAKIPQKIADVMVGHKPDGAKANYQVQQDTVETLYKDAFKFLTINGYGSQSRKLEELETAFNQKSEEQTKQIETQNKQIETLRSILVSVISREKLEELINQKLKMTGEHGAINLKKLSDAQLLELYQKTL